MSSSRISSAEMSGQAPPLPISGRLPARTRGMVSLPPSAAKPVDARPRLRERASEALILVILSPFLALTSGWVPRVLLGVIILDIPLQFGTHLYYRADDAALGALGGLSISATTIALAGLYLSLLVRALVSRNGQAGRRLEINPPLALFVAFSVLSLLVAQDVSLSFFEVFLNLQMYLLFLYVANIMRTREDVMYVVSLLLAGCALEGLIIIILSFTGMPSTIWGIPAHIYIDQGTQAGFMRIGGTVGSPNQAAGYLSLLLAPAASLFFMRLGKAYRWLASTCLGLGAIALIFTYSRGGWAAFALSMAFLGLIFWRRRGMSLRTPVIVLAVLTLLYVPFHSAVSMRLFGDDRGSAESRIPLMNLAFRIIEDNPVLGVGSNNFQLVMPRYLTAEFRQGFRYAVHNKYLLVLAETGIGGFLAYLAFLLGTLRTGWKCWKLNDRLLSPLAIGLTAALAGHMLQMGVEVFRGRPITQLVWLVAGLLVAMYRICSQEQEEDLVWNAT